MKKLGRVSLRAFNTFGCEAIASHVLQIESTQDISRLADSPFNPDSDLLLGGGSNILLLDDVPGTVFLVRLRGRSIVDRCDDSVTLDVAAGESWHETVSWALHNEFFGLENLSLIPGLVGAAPMQNIGAYGVELSDYLDSVLVLDWKRGTRERISADQCGFGYRDSRFKREAPGNTVILSCRLRLDRRFRPRLGYAGLAEELEKAGVTNPGARDVSEAVIRLRTRKLPNPELIGNAGSFFQNPELDDENALALTEKHPGMPRFPAGAGRSKLSAGWMIEQCGWKGHRQGDAGVSEQHALVLVNHGFARGSEILALATNIADSVYQEFGIRLEPEPRICRFGEQA